MSINHDTVWDRECEAWLFAHRCRFLVLSVLLLLVPSIGGCTTRPVEPERRGDVPTYFELVHRYNKRLARLERLRVASFPIVYIWRDEEGVKHMERCNGELAIIVPDRLMLKVKSLATGTFMWAGSNQTHYWFFDLREKKDRRAYFGQHAKLGKGRSRDLPVPLHPRELPWLLGIVPLEGKIATPPPLVRWAQSHLVVDVPGVPMRLWIDPRTYQPVRVDLVNEAGGSEISSVLSNPRLVRLEESSAWPRMATRIIITRLQEDQEIRLTLPGKDMYDYPIHTRWFDLDHLIQLVPDEPGRRIDLDEELEQP